MAHEETSSVTELWLSMQGNKGHKRRKRGNNRCRKTVRPTRSTKEMKTQHKRYTKQIKFVSQWSKERTKDQFKQLVNQTLRFLREASSPAARMAQMKSNKRYKPGD